MSFKNAALAVIVCWFMAPFNASSETGPSAQSDPGAVQWRFHSDLPDGRRIVTDGAFLIDSSYLPDVPVPKQSMPPDAAVRLFGSSTDRNFDLSGLAKSGEHYLGPGPIQLNRKYVDLLRSSRRASSLRFGAKGPLDPVLILDGEKVVGVMMPMKMKS